jgi:hypothetical protein
MKIRGDKLGEMGQIRKSKKTDENKKKGASNIERQ